MDRRRAAAPPARRCATADGRHPTRGACSLARLKRGWAWPAPDTAVREEGRGPRERAFNASLPLACHILSMRLVCVSHASQLKTAVLIEYSPRSHSAAGSPACPGAPRVRACQRAGGPDTSAAAASAPAAGRRGPPLGGCGPRRHRHDGVGSPPPPYCCPYPCPYCTSSQLAPHASPPAPARATPRAGSGST